MSLEKEPRKCIYRKYDGTECKGDLIEIASDNSKTIAVVRPSDGWLIEVEINDIKLLDEK